MPSFWFDVVASVCASFYIEALCQFRIKSIICPKLGNMIENNPVI